MVTHLHPISLSCLRGPWPVFPSSLPEEILRFLEPVLPSHGAGDIEEQPFRGDCRDLECKDPGPLASQVTLFRGVC